MTGGELPVTEGLDLVGTIEVCIIAAAALAVVFHKLRQPALLAYIVAGLLLSAFWRPWVGGSIHALEQVSHFGLVLLLFVIGLELDLRGVFRLGPRAAAAVLLQTPIAVGAILGVQWVLDALGLQLPGLATSSSGWFYFAVAVGLSSTAVVVKLLADRFDLASEAGRLTVLTLIAQDIWAVAALSYVSGAGEGGGALSILGKLGGAALAAAAIILAARYVLSRVLDFLSRSPDLLAVTALAWCFVGTTALSAVGLSAEMGALIAGLSLGALPSATEILAKMVSLRDFFMGLFFVALGMSVPPPTLEVLGAAAALAGITVLARLLLFAPTLRFARLGPVVSLVAPINLAQLSEFSLLLVSVGMARGALSVTEGSVISYAMMFSVVLASYAIKYNYAIALAIGRLFGWGSRPSVFVPVAAGEGPRESLPGSHPPAEVVLLGYHLNADALALRMARDNPGLLARTLVVDYNVKNHAKIRSRGARASYGDISNPETLRHHGVLGARVIVSTVGDAFLRGIGNRQLVRQLKAMNPTAFVVATAESGAHAEELRAAGADACVSPADDAAAAYLEQIARGLERRDAD